MTDPIRRPLVSPRDGNVPEDCTDNQAVRDAYARALDSLRSASKIEASKALREIVKRAPTGE